MTVTKTEININKKIFFLLFNILLLLIAKICAAEISGRIISEKDGSPISFAKVLFLPENTIILSDENGNFRIDNRNKSGTLQISAIGFETKKIEITPKITDFLTIKLSIKPIEISGINVKGEQINSLTFFSNNVEIIDAKNSLEKSIPDLLRSQSGIVVRSYLGNSKSNFVDIRGFGESAATNILVLINGRRINEVDMSGVDWAQIPLNSIERIEIISGSGGVFFGDNAVGGVINILTKTGRGKPFVHASFSNGSYSFTNSECEASGKINNFAYLLHGNYEETEGYRKNSFLKSYNFGGKISNQISDYLDLTLSANYHNDAYGMPGALSADSIKANGRTSTNSPDDKAKTEDFFVKLDEIYNIQFGGKNYGILSTNLSYRNRKSEAEFVSISWTSKNNIKTLSITPRYTLYKNFSGNPKISHLNNKFILGVDYFDAKDEISFDGFGKEQVEISKISSALFANNNLSISKNLDLNCGLRYEKAKYIFTQTPNTKRTEVDEIIGNIGLNSSLKNFHPFAEFSQSFKFPAVDEFYSVWSGLNTNLVPQKAEEIEFGAKQYFYDNNLILKCSFFLMKVENEIFYNPTTWMNENYDKTEHNGLDFEIKFVPSPRFNLFLNHTYTDAKFRDGQFNGKQIPGVPKHKSGFGFSVKPLHNLTFSIFGNRIGERYFMGDFENLGKLLKSYFVVDAKIVLQKWNFSAIFGIDNLFNEKYSEFSVIYYSGDSGNFYPAPERNFSWKLAYKF
ncbi:MAG: TonB-dependent receptor [Candidatus Cloacimonetes bacterium]|nr:TonB-dependent receptor [Candidatus Cloacimonadota bacterium]